MKVFKAKDGFLWADVRPMSKILWQSKHFELYVLNDDGTESLICDDNDFDDAINYNCIIAIELCFLNEITPLN
jgi:hypothetical protein